MGCWNETCGVTQMPIESGDPVRLFLIVEREHSYNKEGGALHYSTDLWRPFGLPLRGLYNDYGGIEEMEEDVFSNFLLEQLKKIVIEVPDRMGERLNKSELTWETALNRLTDEGLRVADPFHISRLTKDLDDAMALILKAYENVPKDQWSPELSKMADKQKDLVEEKPGVVTMYHMMVHEDVYQGLAKFKMTDRYDYTSDKGNYRKRLLQGAEDYIADYRASLPGKKAEEAALAAGDVKTYSTLSIDRRMKRETLGYDNPFARCFDHLDGSTYSSRYIKQYADFIEKKIDNGAKDDDAEIKDLTFQLVDFFQFSGTMSLLRKLWSPQCGKGGQDSEYELHKFLAKTTTNFCNKKIKDRDY